MRVAAVKTFCRSDGTNRKYFIVQVEADAGSAGRRAPGTLERLAPAAASARRRGRQLAGPLADRLRRPCAPAAQAPYRVVPRQKLAMLRAVSRLISGQAMAKISVPWMVPITCRQAAGTPARSSRR